MAVRKVAHPSIDDRKAKGLEARDRAPLSSHSGWSPAADRPDPVAPSPLLRAAASAGLAVRAPRDPMLRKMSHKSPKASLIWTKCPSPVLTGWG